MDSFIGKRFLVLTAHPDDETFAAGGTIYLNSQKGGKTFLSCATHGEAGRANIKNDITDEEVKTMRHLELEDVCKKNGISKVSILDFPDKKLSENKDRLMSVWRSLIVASSPEAIIGFGPDGYIGHIDHVVAGNIARQLAADFKIPFYAVSLPGGDHHDSFEKCLQKKRAYGGYIDHNLHLHKAPDITVEVDPEMKYQAIKIYRSQLPGLDPYNIFSKDDAEHFLRYEYFVRH